MTLHCLRRFRTICLGFFTLAVALPTAAFSQVKWPAIHEQTRPWARWWWEGSAVNNKDLTRVMEVYKDAGLGGLEITPIYGVKGQEANDLNFLSPGWMRVFEHTLQEGQRLGLGIDLANATGWPFGGPWVSSGDASKYMKVIKYIAKGGQPFTQKITFTQPAMVRTEGPDKVDIKRVKRPVSLNKNLQQLALAQIHFEEKLPLVTLMAYDNQNHALELTDKVLPDGTLKWQVPPGNWSLYALFEGQHGKMVERAAPGGEGLVIDHFSIKAVAHYLHRFDQAFAGKSLKGLRGFFNDSYEVDDARGQADYTPGLFQAFKAKRGYDLKDYLPFLFRLARDPEHQQDYVHGHVQESGQLGDTASRVLTDYRQTIGELLLDHFTQYWEHWGKRQHKLIRNQSHGSPANILDLYGAVDIPETEGNDRLRFKFASSAAHVMDKPLISSESATWLKDHFLSSLKDVKSAMDLYFLGGVNHSFYHGVAYSPLDAPWPGWLFYAAVHFEPSNPQWAHFKTLNDYIARCQSFLQSGQPDNDLLQYYPLFDSYADKGKALLKHYDGMKGFEGTDFNKNATALLQNGYSFDFISDRQIMSLKEAGGSLMAPGGHYKSILLSGVQLIPLSTMRQLMDLAKQGATILFYKNLPKDVPGLGDLDRRREDFEKLRSQLRFFQRKDQISGSTLQVATIGKGQMILGDDLKALTRQANVRPESMTRQGLDFVRRKRNGQSLYFIVNSNRQPFKGWVNLRKTGTGAVLYNPMTKVAGLARTKQWADKTHKDKSTGQKLKSAVYLDLRPGETVIVQETKATKTKAEAKAKAKAPVYPLYTQTGEPIILKGPWQLSFEKGGPVLPAAIKLTGPRYWTTLGDSLMNRFSGIGSYETVFSRPAGKRAGAIWRLGLSQVKESAAVFLNGHKIGVLLGSGGQLIIPDSLLKDKNILQIKVASLMANRIRYMDRHQLAYKVFYNTNFPAHDAVNRGPDGLFTAAGWKVLPAGLSGKVTLTPIKEMKTWP